MQKCNLSISHSVERHHAEGRKNMEANKGPEKILRKSRHMESLDC
jgi:hypothetical protein